MQATRIRRIKPTRTQRESSGREGNLPLEHIYKVIDILNRALLLNEGISSGAIQHSIQHCGKKLGANWAYWTFTGSIQLII